ncbi:hypothetical protein MKX03_033641 [Papaver bracteatum]|nr:hypothetical protein MKX03_033641 [Papaver bracteatum]
MKIFHSSLLSLMCLISLIVTANSTTVLYPASELSNEQNTQEIETVSVCSLLDKGTKVGNAIDMGFTTEKYVRLWALQRKSDCSLQHSFPEGNFKLGENIYWGSGTSWEPTDAVNAWAGEEKFYSYASNTCQAGKECGPYTQIVWRNTRRIGCVRVECDDGDVRSAR